MLKYTLVLLLSLLAARHALVLSLSHAASSWGDSFQPIITQISSGNNECNSDELSGYLNLKDVPQFNALCNMPVPDIQQSDFLLENNIVPILCMGLMDVSFRTCKSAKSDVTPFKEILSPSKNTFVELSKLHNYSSLDEFCSNTVKGLAIKEASSDVTRLWWQVLNDQLSDEKRCSEICHSKEESKVHLLCSYILWANGIYLNYLNNTIHGQVPPVGDDQKSLIAQQLVKLEDKAIKSVQDGFDSTKTTDTVISSSLAPLLGDKTQIVEQSKSNFTTDNNTVYRGSVKQVIKAANQSVTGTEVNPHLDKGTLVKEKKEPKSKHLKNEEIATTSNTVNSNTGIGAVNLEKPTLTGQAEAKDNPKTGADAVSSSQPGPQGFAEGNLPEPQKEIEANQGPEDADAIVAVDPGDVTPDGNSGMSFKDQPPYPDDEGEEGDGDDVNILKSNDLDNINTVSNSSIPAVSKITSYGKGSIQQGPPETLYEEDHFYEAEDSNFFTYFLCMAVLTIMAYLAFHNKKKLIALAVEGRRTKGARRRPNSSHYSKLDCSLEEALVSNTTASVTHVLY